MSLRCRFVDLNFYFATVEQFGERAYAAGLDDAKRFGVTKGAPGWAAVM